VSSMRTLFGWGFGPRLAIFILVVLDGACRSRFALGAYTDAKPLRFKGDFNPFRVLELPPGLQLPSADVLKKAFKKAALKWHPDRCGRTKPKEECEKRMEEVHMAQDVLSDSRRLQQWEAWVEEKSGRGPKPESERRKPFGQPRGGDGGGGSGGFDGFPNFDFGSGGGGGGRPGQKSKRPQRPPPPPRPTPRPNAGGPWKEVKRERIKGTTDASVEVITRERPLAGTPMIQVEVLEKTCYKAQVQCQEQVLERRRRRKDDNDEL